MCIFFRFTPQSEDDHFYELRLSPGSMKLLSAMAEDIINGKKLPKQAGERLKTELAGARKMNEALVELPWGKLHEWAVERHSSDADALWDWERK